MFFRLKKAIGLFFFDVWFSVFLLMFLLFQVEEKRFFSLLRILPGIIVQQQLTL